MRQREAEPDTDQRHQEHKGFNRVRAGSVQMPDDRRDHSGHERQLHLQGPGVLVLGVDRPMRSDTTPPSGRPTTAHDPDRAGCEIEIGGLT